MAKQNYMFLFRGQTDEGLSPEQFQENMQKWFAWVEKLQNKGVYKGGEALVPGGKVLSQKTGKYQVDGPYAETKEQVGGYFLVEANSLDEAIEMAKDYPDFYLNGKVEIREVMILPAP